MEHKLWDILPKVYTYKLIHFENSEPDNFDCTFKINLFNERDVLKWLRAFEQSSFTNFRVSRTAPGKHTRVIFKKYYRCHRNTRANETASKTKKPHSKHTNCEANLLITVNNWRMKKCRDTDLKHYPCCIKYHNFHNHKICSVDSLSYRKPNEQIERKISDLLLKNHSPAIILKILKQDLQHQYKDKYPEILNDGSFCPKLQWIYHKYYKVFKRSYPDGCISQSCSNNELIECEDEESDSSCKDIEFSEITSKENILNAENNLIVDETKCETCFLEGLPMISGIDNLHCDNFIEIVCENNGITENYVGENDYDYLSVGKEETVSTFQ